MQPLQRKETAYTALRSGFGIARRFTGVTAVRKGPILRKFFNSIYSIPGKCRQSWHAQAKGEAPCGHRMQRWCPTSEGNTHQLFRVRKWSWEAGRSALLTWSQPQSLETQLFPDPANKGNA